MTRKEFVAVCVEHNIQYDIDPKCSISISAPKGKVLGDVHCADYYLEDEPMSDAYQEVVDTYINYIDDCDDPECDCHNEPDRPVVVPEVSKPVIHKNTHPAVIEEKVVWNEVGVRDGVEYKHAQRFIFNDGGRKAAGYHGHTGDCVTRSIAIVTGKPYKEVYDAINQLSENERKVASALQCPLLKNICCPWVMNGFLPCKSDRDARFISGQMNYLLADLS